MRPSTWPSESPEAVSRRRWSAQEKRTRRNAAARQGFDEVVVSDASVPGDGEVKCVEYLDACAREAARSGDPRPRDVVLYGGDVDLVLMALCRAQPGPGPVFGPHVRSILVLSDAGRVLDVGALAEVKRGREGAGRSPAVGNRFVHIVLYMSSARFSFGCRRIRSGGAADAGDARRAL